MVQLITINFELNEFYILGRQTSHSILSFNDNFPIFEQELKNLDFSTDPTDLSSCINDAFDIINKRRVDRGIDIFARGVQPWYGLNYLCF
jgi:hypothetical protein